MGEVLGIDVSHYQLDIDWKKVADAGKRFAILKAMYEAKSHNKDEYFEANYKGAGDNGIKRGVYIFIASESIRDPERDARSLLGHLGGRVLEYGIWLDYESQVLRQQGSKRIEDLTYIYADLFRQAGYYTGIYCNKDWYDHVISERLKTDFDFWIARYPKNDTGEYKANSSLRPSYKTAAAWQYSSKGHVPGIKGNVDMDADFDGIVDLMAQEPYKKDIYTIAMEVLEGKWGTAKTCPSREKLLTMAGYDYKKVQRLVNELKRRET